MTTMGKSSSFDTAKAPEGAASAQPSSSPSSLSAEMSASKDGKRLTDPENDLNGVSATKRNRIGGVAAASSSTARTPFGGGSKASSATTSSSGSKLSVSSDPDKTEVFTAQHVRPARWQGDQVAAIALVRIQNEYAAPSSLIATSDDTLQELVVRSILGRNVSSASDMDTGSSVAANKIDLGIGPENRGVSRKHLQVTEVRLGTNPSVRIQCCPGVKQEVAIRRYNSGENAMSPILELLNRDYEGGRSLEPGDVLVMDEYRRSCDRSDGPPQHKFRVVVVPAHMHAVDSTQESPHDVVQASGDLTSYSQHDDNLAVDMTSKKQQRETEKRLAAQEPLIVAETAKADEAPEPSSQMSDAEEFTVSELAAADNDGDDDKKMPAVPSRMARNEDIAVADGTAAPDAQQLHGESEEKTCENEQDNGRNEFASQGGVAVRREPRVGDYFHVLFEDVDMFENKVPCWYIGEAVRVNTSGENAYSLRLIFDGNYEEEYQFDYPSSEVQILSWKPDVKRYIKVKEGSGNSTPNEELEFDTDPRELHAGDLVESRYPDRPDQPTTWYRGRVISADEQLKTCEICYYNGPEIDKAAECFVAIPMGKGYVRLIQRGHSDLTWLENVEAPITGMPFQGRIVETSRKKDKNGNEWANVVDAHSDISLKLRAVVRTVDGPPRAIPYVQTYAETVPALFQSMKMKAAKDNNLFIWASKSPAGEPAAAE